MDRCLVTHGVQWHKASFSKQLTENIQEGFAGETFLCRHSSPSRKSQGESLAEVDHTDAENAIMGFSPQY